MTKKACPILRRSLHPCSVNDYKELSFTLAKFPDWTLSHHTQNIGHLQHLMTFTDDIWFDNQLLDFLNEYPQGIEQSLLSLRHENGQLILLSVQDFVFRPGQQLRQPTNVTAKNLIANLRNGFAKAFSFKALTFGQFMVSGHYGWRSNNEVIEKKDKQQLAELIHAAAFELAKKIGGYHAVLLKDLCLGTSELSKQFEQLGYHATPVDASMHMGINSNWETIDDYLLDITSKYRVRYRRTRKQLPENHIVKSLTLEECYSLERKLHDLYYSVKSEAEFDAISLQPSYFASLKEVLGNRFNIYAYFIDNELVAFYTSISNGGVLHAHYLGFSQSLNRTYHLYHNMLFDLLERAIEGGYTMLDYGRTALEIKSSIGAVPEAYFCGIKAVNPLADKLIPLFMPSLFQSKKWVQRKPLKAQKA